MSFYNDPWNPSPHTKNNPYYYQISYEWFRQSLTRNQTRNQESLGTRWRSDSTSHGTRWKSDIKPKQSHTWIFKQILAERKTAIQWIQISPGNGIDINFWTDPWKKFGPLISFIGPQGPRNYGLPLSTRVADVWIEDSWHLPPARSSEMEELLIYLAPLSLSESPSFHEWIFNNRKRLTFSSSEVYHSLLEPTPSVPWLPIIWLKRGIPRHKTLAWLMFLNRCPTRDRLRSWGLQTDHLCLLCNRSSE